MNRTYNRDTVQWDQSTLTVLVEEGQATAYQTALGTIYVVKLPEGGSVKVTPTQIISTDEVAHWNEVAEIALTDVIEHQADTRWAENLVEEYLTALHGPAENRDGEFDDQARVLVDRLVNADEDREYANTLRDAICEAERATATRTRTSWVAADEQDEILKYFGI